MENAIDKITPTASPYYFTNPENKNIQVARPMNIGVNIGEPVYEAPRPDAEKTKIDPYIPVPNNISREQLPTRPQINPYIPVNVSRN